MNNCEWCKQVLNSQGICVACESHSLKAVRNELNDILLTHGIELVSLADIPTLKKNGVMMPIWEAIK